MLSTLQAFSSSSVGMAHVERQNGLNDVEVAVRNAYLQTEVLEDLVDKLIVDIAQEQVQKPKGLELVNTQFLAYCGYDLILHDLLDGGSTRIHAGADGDKGLRRLHINTVLRGRLDECFLDVLMAN